MIRIMRTIFPLILCMVVFVFLWRGLHIDPHDLPSALLNKPLPTFDLTDVKNEGGHFSNKDLLNKVSLINVWATWCLVCRKDNDVLMDLAEKHHIPIYGIDYKDDREAAKSWLKTYGDPYQKSGYDEDGRVAIDLGVYGTPETYIVDKKGVVRYKHVGPMTQAIWTDEMLPLIKQLKGSGKG